MTKRWSVKKEGLKGGEVPESRMEGNVDKEVCGVNNCELQGPAIKKEVSN